MVENDSLVAKLATTYPEFEFQRGDIFRWSPETRTVYYATLSDPHAAASLLHEIGHGLCGHSTFTQDIDLLKMEREAWTKAALIAPSFDVRIDEDTVENALESYREWLDARSRCPNCGQTGLQETENSYRCVICHVGWRVNDARQCGLRRYTL